MKLIKESTILVKPLISEKSIAQANGFNKYTFIVGKAATKVSVAKEVARKFSVKVENVKMANVLGKQVRWGKARLSGVRSSYKKAIVTLKKGDKIEIFEIK
jgi:large subunit ribosomal protein L23